MSLLNKIFSKWEQWSGRNHFSPLLSLYVNLRLLPFRQAVKMPIYVYGRPHLMDLAGRVKFTCRVRRGLVRLNVVDLTPAPRGSRLELAIRGTVIFGGEALIRSNTKVYVDNVATMTVGHGLRMGAGCILNCLHRIEIGEGVRIGHRSQIMDNNSHFVLNAATGVVPTLRKRVQIGSHSWLTNSVTVYGGGVIPPYSIVVSGTVVNKDLSALGRDNIIGGAPARSLANGMRLVNNYRKEREINEFYIQNPEGRYRAEPPYAEEEWFVNPADK